MDERELSKLSFLAQALVRTPTRYRELLGAITDTRLRLSRPSDDLERATAALEREFAKEDLGPRGGTRVLRQIAERLLKSSMPAERSAGRSLAWALENQPTRKTG